MTDTPDAELLEQFARNHSEAAFATLVQRHVALVHSVALRHTANPQHAQDITQAVFIILARKAATLGRKTVLPGWLYHAARLTAANFQRAEARRIRREQEAFMQSSLQEPQTDAVWRELSPRLDEAMACLGASERDALVLRYFQNKSIAEVGKFLGLAENTAQKRVSRALEKLRDFFTKRGVSLTTAIIAGAVSANSVQAAPAALAKTATAVAVAKGAAATTPTLTLIKGALKIMAWTKVKTSVVIGVGLLLAAGTATITVKEIQEHSTYPWQDIPIPTTPEQANVNEAMLKEFPPQVRIIPTKFPQRGSMANYWVGDGERVLGIASSLDRLILQAYQVPPTRVIFPAGLSKAQFDCIANLPKGSFPALQREVERKFGLVVTRQMREMDVLLLKVRLPNAPGLQPAGGQTALKIENGRYEVKRQPLSLLANILEISYFNIPVVDRTGLAGLFDVALTWDSSTPTPNLDALKESLLTQLGLELVPSREPIEMLVVEKAQ